MSTADQRGPFTRRSLLDIMHRHQSHISSAKGPFHERLKRPPSGRHQVADQKPWLISTLHGRDESLEKLDNFAVVEVPQYTTQEKHSRAKVAVVSAQFRDAAWSERLVRAEMDSIGELGREGLFSSFKELRGGVVHLKAEPGEEDGKLTGEGAGLA